MSTGTDTKQEKWRNEAAGLWYIKRIVKGEEELVAINGGKVFHISAEERRLNQDEAAPGMDPFTNGTFTFLDGMEVITSEEDREAIFANPNALGVDEMTKLYDQATPYGEVTARVALVTNTLTLRRMLEVGRESDASMRKVQAVEARLAELEAEAAPTNVSETAGTVTPSAGMPAPQKASWRNDLGPGDIRVGG